MIDNGVERETSEGFLQEACAELSRRLRAGEDCRAETILDSYPTLASETDRVIDLIYAEFTLREELGQQPAAGEYYRRFPQLREPLERQFQVHALLCNQSAAIANPAALSTLAPAPDDAADDESPKPWVDGYELLEEIGRGGRGVVYKARQLGLNRVVALKMILAGEYADAEDLKRFRREAEGLAQLTHPNIVQVYAVGQQGKLPFFSMEYLEGGSLEKRAAGKPQPGYQAAQWIEAVARGVHYAHERRLIHRDLKPANIVLTADGVPKVTDFGLAKWLEGQASKTHEGDIRGTPSYMAPEQAAGRIAEVGVHTDVYGLGAILYELMTARPPFRGSTSQETLLQVIEQDLTPPRALNPSVDAELEAVCLKCLEKKPARRYATAADLADDLARWLRHERTVARPRSWLARIRRSLRRHWLATAAAVLVVVATVATVAGVKYLDPDRPRKEIEAELAAGRSVELIGETGLPKWFRWSRGDPRASVTVSDQGDCSVQSWELGLLELVPNPQHDSYRFSVELRQDAAADINAQVGIYVVHNQQTDNDSSPVHIYCALAYGDVSIAGETPLLLELTRQHYCEARVNPRHRTVYAAKRISPVERTDPERWRHLILEVTPIGLRAFWGANKKGDVWAVNEMGTLAFAQLLKDDHNLISELPDLIPNVAPCYRPRAALGLYVYRSTASLRSATVAPLFITN